jgi:hypothetical protein
VERPSGCPPSSLPRSAQRTLASLPSDERYAPRGQRGSLRSTRRVLPDRPWAWPASGWPRSPGRISASPPTPEPCSAQPHPLGRASALHHRPCRAANRLHSPFPLPGLPSHPSLGQRAEGNAEHRMCEAQASAPHCSRPSIHRLLDRSFGPGADVARRPATPVPSRPRLADPVRPTRRPDTRSIGDPNRSWRCRMRGNAPAARRGGRSVRPGR